MAAHRDRKNQEEDKEARRPSGQRDLPVDAVVVITFGDCACRVGRPDEAWRCIGEAIDRIEATKERWCEAEVNRMAGEIALLAPGPDTAEAQAYFERALTVARVQQAKSWELRAAMSMARLWRDQGKRDAARDLLTPVYGWFTEGFVRPGAFMSSRTRSRRSYR